jgi:hypothetical protein
MTEKRKRGRPVGTKSDSPPRGVLTIKVSDQEREAFKALGGAKWFREILKTANS